METLESFFPWLLRASWQASVLAGLVLIAQGLFRQKLSAGWRYSLWLLVVLRLLLPAAPESVVSVFNLAPFRPAPGTDLTFQRFNDVTPSLVPDNPSQPTLPVTSAPTTTSPPSPNATPLRAAAAPHSTLTTLLTWSPTLWLIRVALLLLRILCQNVRFVARIRAQRPVTDSAVLDLLEDCKSLMGVRTPLSVVETSAVKSPALCGFIRPRLLLPENLLASFTPRELRYVLLHELAHVKRLDMAMNWVVTALRVLHWFNPVLWFAFRRLAADRELAADALALARARDGESEAYGQTVIKLLESFTRRAALPGLIGILEEKQQMKERVAMIAQFKKTSPWPVLAVAVLIALGLVSLTDAQTRKGAEALTRKSTSDEGNHLNSKTHKEPKSYSVNSKETAAGLTLRKLIDVPDEMSRIDAVSPDGLFLVGFRGNSASRPIIYDLTKHTLRTHDGRFFIAHFSADGRQIIGNLRDADNRSRLRVAKELVAVDLATETTRRVYRDESIREVIVRDVSLDGKSILR